jgi:TaqI-like C-terminal specificity domain/Eco57I restriction-modification methylase
MNPANCQPQLQQPYRRESWQKLLSQLLPGVELFSQAHDFPLTSDNERGIATARRQFGAATLADGKRIAFYEIEVAPGVQLQSNRVGLRSLIVKCIDEVSAHAVLAFFVQPGKSFYRLTYAAKESKLGEDLKIQTEQTATRRFTYILGAGESCRTAAERFGSLPAAARLTDLTEAFSVEKLNKEFFADFRKAFELVVKDILDRNHGWERATAESETQTLLSRLLFLYFIQRKGWLSRQRDYLVSAFNRHYAEDRTGISFYDQFLRPFFVKLSAEEAFFPNLDLGDLPFLNGGLFDDEIGSLTERGRMKVGNPVLRQVFDHLLEAYNFTVREDTPLDQEVAIDPEMLGKIFETLVLQLEQSDTGGKTSRHDTGSYYTPRPIVHYLCREGLRVWLEQFPPPSASKSADWPARLEKLFALDATDGLDDNERARLNDLLTPDEARALLDRLDNFRACDLAVGSGAFVVGLLHELVNLRRLCETRARGKDPATDIEWLYETKKRIIENVLYGVDIQQRAVEICKLRLWISLMVDYPLEVDPDNCALPDFRRAIKKITPLPNLDFKIRRANSLIEQIRGHAVKFPQTATDSRDFNLSLNKLATAKHRFYEARRKKDKRLARLDILEATAELAKYEFNAAKLKFGLLPSDQDAERAAELDRAEAEMGKLQMQIAAARTKAKRDMSAVDDDIERLSRVFNDEAKPTFVWQLDFAEIFHRSANNLVRENLLPDEERADKAVRAAARSGFDLVMANPPYIDSETMTKEQPGEREACVRVFRSAKGNWDLFVVFIERALTILANQGVISYIVPNKLIGAPYAETIREILAENCIREIRDYSHVDVFTEAAVYPITIIAQKTPNKNPVRMTVMKSVELVGSWNSIEATTFHKDSQWARYFEKPASLAILQKCSAFPPLHTFVSQITGAATVSEAYEIKNCVKEHTGKETKSFKKLVNTGSIDRYSILWGVKPTRYIKGSYEKPIVLDEDLSAISRKRLQQSNTPKIIIGGMTLALECVYDDGKCLAGKSTTIIYGSDVRDLKYVLGILNSSLITFWYRITYQALTLAGGYLRINSNEIKSIPIPAASATEQAALSGLVDGILAAKRTGDAATVTALESEIDAHVFRLYDLTPDEIAVVKSTATKT